MLEQFDVSVCGGGGHFGCGNLKGEYVRGAFYVVRLINILVGLFLEEGLVKDDESFFSIICTEIVSLFVPDRVM